MKVVISSAGKVVISSIGAWGKIRKHITFQKDEMLDILQVVKNEILTLKVFKDNTYVTLDELYENNLVTKEEFESFESQLINASTFSRFRGKQENRQYENVFVTKKVTENEVFLSAVAQDAHLPKMLSTLCIDRKLYDCSPNLEIPFSTLVGTTTPVFVCLKKVG